MQASDESSSARIADRGPTRSITGTRGPLPLVVATAIGSLGLGAGGTAGAIVAVEVTGDDAAAGLPLGVLVVGSAIGALIIAWISHRRGRLAGLTAGYLLGVLGAVLVVGAIQVSSFVVVLLGSLLLGAANAAVFLTRYAAADVAAVGRRGQALGAVLAATAGGAIAGVFLLGPAGDAAASLGLSAPAGLYVLAVGAFALAAAVLAQLDTAGPSASGRRLAAPGRVEVLRPVVRALRYPAARTALATLATGNLVMSAIMVVMPVHLTGHDHQLGGIGLLIAIHVVGMLAPSPLTGRLADRFGGQPVGLAGSAVLMLTAVVWSGLPDANDVAVGMLLLALGIGWNGAVVGGSAVLTAAVPGSSLLDAEAGGEVAMGLAAAVGAPLAGLFLAGVGFPGLCLAAAIINGIALIWCRRSETRPRRRVVRFVETDRRPMIDRDRQEVRVAAGALHRQKAMHPGLNTRQHIPTADAPNDNEEPQPANR